MLFARNGVAGTRSQALLMSSERKNLLSVIGAPSSAGAYAPGQERTPDALRKAGLFDHLRSLGIDVHDLGDTEGFRWQVDRENPRAMNPMSVARAIRSTANLVERALGDGGAALVIGGDCTIELGTVAGALRSTDNVEPFERQIIRELGIENVPLAQVASEPAAAAERVVNAWARKFERLLIHLDVDVLDFADMPLAENTRRNVGLKFDQLVAALMALLAAPNWAALTVCEVNPDHGQEDGSTLDRFVGALSTTIASAARYRRGLRDG
jgi:arginase family enzyme